jgi:hypothetical protein
MKKNLKFSVLTSSHSLMMLFLWKGFKNDDFMKDNISHCLQPFTLINLKLNNDAFIR